MNFKPRPRLSDKQLHVINCNAGRLPVSKRDAFRQRVLSKLGNDPSDQALSHAI